MNKPFVVERVYRLCHRCGRWRSLGCFNRGTGRVCSLCYTRMPVDVHGQALARTIALTDKAREFLAAERAAA